MGGAEVIGFRIVSDADLAKAIEAGLPVRAIDALKACHLGDREIGEFVIKPRTLSHRRAKGQRLTIEESDRAARLARVIALAERTFADDDKARRWLHKALAALDGRRPIDLLHSDAGARIVEGILAKIAWGAAA